MASRRARQRGDKHDRWDEPPWQQQRDDDETELPEPEETEPVHTLTCSH